MSPSSKVVFYWLSALLLFIGVNATVNWMTKNQGDSVQTVAPLNLTTNLDIQPGRYYQLDGIYHLDLTGSTQLILAVNNIPENPALYDTLVIKGLNKGRLVNLYWQWQNESKTEVETSKDRLYKYQLSGHKNSINVLPPDWRNSDIITQLSLVIEVDIALGFVKKIDDNISWQSIELTHHSLMSPNQQLMSNIGTFVPLDYSSLNLHSSNNELVYQQLLIRIGFWLVLVIGLYLIIKPSAKHILITLLLAWLFVTAVYGYNFSRQITTHSNRFIDNKVYLNSMDERLFTIAQTINQTIEKKSGKTTSTKVYIIGRDKFKTKRLNYHLLNHNSGVVNTLGVLFNKDHQNSGYVVLIEPHLDLCHKAPSEDEEDAFKVLISDKDFCLVNL